MRLPIPSVVATSDMLNRGAVDATSPGSSHCQHPHLHNAMYRG